MEEKTQTQKISQVYGYILGAYMTARRDDPMYPIVHEAFENVMSVMSYVARKEKEEGIEQ